MTAANSADTVREFQSRVETAVANTPYRMTRTGQGFDLVVGVRGRYPQTHTYRVVLRPRERDFTMTDVVRSSGRRVAGPDGQQRTTKVTSGRSVYVVVTSRGADGGEPYRFSSADGHRLIRGVARELGWREARPAVVKGAIAAGIVGGLVALGTLLALAFVFLI
ncbi:hypothetical protein [Streptomyces sp. L2]|uniref:hypothetical protein n=1 Tax=Streptomyces sp. L2 TaxID=2162665 RepID=UPI001010A852|nr:hypothetical protein [Streptomyces sp. L2]